MKKTVLSSLVLALLLASVSFAQIPRIPYKSFVPKTASANLLGGFQRVITVCSSTCDYTTTAKAYTYLGTQTVDATHQWAVLLMPNATDDGGATPANVYKLSVSASVPVNYAASASPAGDATSLRNGNTAGKPGTCSAGAFYEDTQAHIFYLCTATNTWTGFAETVPASVTITNAAGGSTISLVTFQVKNGAGANIAYVAPITVWLSDAATCIGLTGTTADGAVAAGASGTDLGALTAKKAITAVTDATGKYILSITDSAKTGFYPCATVPGTGTISAGAQLTSGSYGA